MRPHTLRGLVEWSKCDEVTEVGLLSPCGWTHIKCHSEAAQVSDQCKKNFFKKDKQPLEQ